MSRNLKATGVVTGLYAIALALGLFGAMVKPETRITGTIAGEKVDIAAWEQDDPKYDKKIKNAKVEQGWGGLRLLLWVTALAPAGLGLALSGERQAELDKERREYDRAIKEEELLADVQTAYKVGLKKTLLKKRGEATVALEEDRLEEEVDSIREANGWFAPANEQSPQRAIEPPLLREKEAIESNPFEGMKTPEQYAIEIEEARQGAIARLKADGSDGASEVRSDDRKTFYQERGEKVMRSLASLKMSILNAAPTGAGKTHTLYRWLGDLQALYPQNEVYVIAHKRDSFLGLLEQGRVAIFQTFNPEIALQFLDKVYSIMEKRLNEPEGDRKKFEKMPVRLILDDWFASFDVLKKHYPQLWATVSMKLGAIITKGREANVCLYIGTQSFILESLGIQDSNIRGNLAITCQGLVTEVLNDFGELVEQGSYETLQMLISNKFIVGSKQDRDRLNAELEEVIVLSRLHKVPAIFCAVGRNTLGLAPYYEKPLANNVSESTNVAVVDRNEVQEGLDLWEEFEKDLARRRQKKADYDAELHASDYTQSSDSDGCDGANTCNTPGNAGNAYQSNEQSNAENFELENWYKWLPSKAEMIAMLEELPPIYNLAYVVKTKLKKTEAMYNRKAKGAIVKLLLDTGRNDLIEKLEIDPNAHPFLG